MVDIVRVVLCNRITYFRSRLTRGQLRIRGTKISRLRQAISTDGRGE